MARRAGRFRVLRSGIRGRSGSVGRHQKRRSLEKLGRGDTNEFRPAISSPRTKTKLQHRHPDEAEDQQRGKQGKDGAFARGEREWHGQKPRGRREERIVCARGSLAKSLQGRLDEMRTKS